MARPATRKFERPPTFGGLGEEDVVDWQARYEKVGKYNGWTDGDMAGNYAQFQEGKLRSRKQGHGESALDYYYDVIALCKAADPTMGEQAKVNYLMGGLSAELTTKMYVMKINQISSGKLSNWNMRRRRWQKRGARSRRNFWPR